MSKQDDKALDGAARDLARTLVLVATLAPIAALGYGTLLWAAGWIAGLGAGWGLCYAAGWAWASLLLCVDQRRRRDPSVVLDPSRLH